MLGVGEHNALHWCQHLKLQMKLRNSGTDCLHTNVFPEFDNTQIIEQNKTKQNKLWF